jgi:hypothetical protein
MSRAAAVAGALQRLDQPAGGFTRERPLGLLTQAGREPSGCCAISAAAVERNLAEHECGHGAARIARKATPQLEECRIDAIRST